MAFRRLAQRRQARFHPAAESPASCQRRRSDDERSKPASPATSWPSACSRPRRRRSICPNETAGNAAPCTASTHKETSRQRPQLSAGAPAGRTRRALRAALHGLRQQVGCPHRRRREPRAVLQRIRPADRRLAQGPQAPRPARQHAGDLGRRIRPHADERKRQRPRPQPLRLHDVDGRRRRASAAPFTARPTKSACTPSRTKPTSTTSTPRSCTCWASTTKQLTFLHNGRDERLTITSGQVIKDVIL